MIMKFLAYITKFNILYIANFVNAKLFYFAQKTPCFTSSFCAIFLHPQGKMMKNLKSWYSELTSKTCHVFEYSRLHAALWNAKVFHVNPLWNLFKAAYSRSAVFTVLLKTVKSVFKLNDYNMTCSCQVIMI